MTFDLTGRAILASARAAAIHQQSVPAGAHADYYAAKGRIVEVLLELGATSVDTAAPAAILGDELAEAAAMVAARGAEVRYRIGVGYYLGRVRNNGRS